MQNPWALAGGAAAALLAVGLVAKGGWQLARAVRLFRR
jgi:hypothetical protein